jgi:hypothetical protein
MEKAKKIVGLFLSLTLVISLLTGIKMGTVHADDTIYGYINGSAITGTNLYYKNGAATTTSDPTGANASYNPTTNTLTLDGLNITATSANMHCETTSKNIQRLDKNWQTTYEDNYAAIYFPNDANIVINGDNTISIPYGAYPYGCVPTNNSQTNPEKKFLTYYYCIKTGGKAIMSGSGTINMNATSQDYEDVIPKDATANDAITKLGSSIVTYTISSKCYPFDTYFKYGTGFTEPTCGGICSGGFEISSGTYKSNTSLKNGIIADAEAPNQNVSSTITGGKIDITSLDVIDYSSDSPFLSTLTISGGDIGASEIYMEANLVVKDKASIHEYSQSNKASITSDGTFEMQGGSIAYKNIEIADDSNLFDFEGDATFTGGTTTVQATTPGYGVVLYAGNGLTISGSATNMNLLIKDLKSGVLNVSSLKINSDNYCKEVFENVYNPFIVTNGKFIGDIATDVDNVPSVVPINADVILPFTVKPSGAPVNNIVWEVSDAGTTGATITSVETGKQDSFYEEINNYKLNVPNKGTFSLKASIENGNVKYDADNNCDFTKIYTFTAKDPVAVTGITGVPTSGTAGTPVTLTGTVAPEDATSKNITWSVADAGTTGATISGDKLSATGAGTAKVKATIANGNITSAYTQEFTVTFKMPAGDVNVDVKNDTTAPTTQLTNTKSDLEEKVLTESELAAVKNGEDANIYLEIKDVNATVPSEEKKAVEDLLSKDKLATYFDISMYVKQGSNTRQVTSTDGTVTVSIKIPSEYINTDSTVTRIYYIIRYHDGVATKLEAKYDAATGTLTFATDKFSTYALAYADKSDATTPTEQTKSSTNTTDTTGTTTNTTGTTTNTTGTTANTTGTTQTSPKTGNSAPIWPWVVMISSGLILIVTDSKKRFLRK